MRQENPYFSAIRRADKIIGDNQRSVSRWFKGKKKAKEYLDSQHLFKLIDCNTGKELDEERISMSGRVAKATNEALRDSFREDVGREIDAGVPFGKTVSIMKRWVQVKQGADSPS